MKLNPLYSDQQIVVINKTAGIPVLPDGWDRDAPYLVQLLEAEYGKIWVVHRLDKNTSGVMVFARTAEAHRSLNIQFDQHEAIKVYHATCIGEPKWDEHIARHPLRIDVGHSHRSVVDNAKGVPAETTFRIMQRLGGFCLLEVLPGSGRTHQIRVHAYALGIPLLGDVLYSAPKTALISRPALHAKSLTFVHPGSGERMSFATPYPEDFNNALKTLQQMNSPKR